MKKKRFRRMKVSSRGYVSGKRLQVFRAVEKRARDRQQPNQDAKAVRR